MTRLEAQPLAETDRRIVNLEPETNSEKKEFLKLCQAVSCLRIHYAGADSRKSLSDVEDLKEIFDFGTILGPTNVNQLLHYTAKRKLRKDWRALAARAHEMRARFAPRINENQVLEEEDAVDETPLYYQAYLADRLGKEDAFLEMEQSSKERFSAYLRRKQRAALLYICAQFGIARIPYGGWHAVVSMSDGCIRDFLEIMAEIFEEFQTTRSDKINAFSRANVRLDVQRAAIRRASDNKFRGIKEDMESHTAEGSLLVECLGTLCARLQSNYNSLDGLRTAERGIFLFDLENVGSAHGFLSSEVSLFIKQVLERCEVAGLLRDESEKWSLALGDKARGKMLLGYRLHRRFAPHFGFSYGGPFSPVFVPIEDVQEICVDPDSVDVDEWVRRVEGKVRIRSDTQHVFDFRDSSN